MIAALAIAALTLAQAPPVEDVGVVFRSTAGAGNLVSACPRVAVVEASAGGAELVRSLLAACPRSEAVFQLPSSGEVDPVVAGIEDARLRANTYWTFVAPGALTPFSLATPGERAALWLAAPRFDSVPSWRSDATCTAGALFCAADYVGGFYAELHLLARTAGFRGIVLPPHFPRPGDRTDAFCALLAGVDRASPAAFDLAWTWDAVSPDLALSAIAESTTTFGFRLLRSTCPPARVHPLLVRVSSVAGWQRATAAGFIEWLRFLDSEVDLDPDPFLGLALNGFGTGDQNDLAPFSAELAAFLVDPAAPIPGDPGGGGGGVGPPTPPPSQPGSALGPDRGPSMGCSTTGSPLGAAALAAVPFAVRRRRGRVTRPE